MKVERLLIVSSLALGLACGSEKRPSPAAGGAPSSAGADSGVSGDGASPAGRFGASECRACLAETCAGSEMACNGEPACASYLTCLDACPVDEQGALDAECARACRLPQDAEVEALALHVSDCRDRGYGAGCGCSSARTLPPLLQQVCPASTSENACHACEDERCCETKQACLADDDCTAFLACLDQCSLSSSAACNVDCGDLYPEGYELFVTRNACVSFRCGAPSECGNDEPDPCVQCWYERCWDELLACDMSSACQRMSSCSVACGAGECRDSCDVSDPAAAALRDAFLSCATARCVSECATTGDEPP